jgi:hypothetical protein
MALSPYETSDVYLASYLLCQGASLVGTERVGPRRTVFRFASDEYLHSLLRVYWSNDRILVPPTHLFHALRKLKSRIRRKPQAAPAADTTHDTNAAAERTAGGAEPSEEPSPHPHAEP